MPMKGYERDKIEMSPRSPAKGDSENKTMGIKLYRCSLRMENEQKG